MGILRQWQAPKRRVEMRVPAYKPQEDGRPPGVLKDMRWDPERLLNKLGSSPLGVYDRRYDNHPSAEQEQWPAPSLNGIQAISGQDLYASIRLPSKNLTRRSEHGLGPVANALLSYR